jgi:hypothetical protein
MRRESTFPAPTQKLELKLVELAINEFNLNLDNFWYNWFPANIKNNHSLHLNSDVLIDSNLIREKFKLYFDVTKIFSIKIIDLHKLHQFYADEIDEVYEDFRFKHIIHFKLNEK